MELSLSRLEISRRAIHAYLTRLDQLKQWLNDRVKAIEWCLDRVRRVEKVVAGATAAPPLPGDCQPHFLLVACYADLARQALHGPPDENTSSEWAWLSNNADRLFGHLHDAAMAAGFAVLAATDQHLPAAAPRVVTRGYEAAAAATTTDNLTAKQRRQYTSLMLVIPPLEKPIPNLVPNLGQLFSSLTKSFHYLIGVLRDILLGDADNSTYGGSVFRNFRSMCKGEVDKVPLSFADLVTHGRPIVDMFSLPPGRKLLLANTDLAPPDYITSMHQEPSVLMEQLVDVVMTDVSRRFQIETLRTNCVLSQLTRSFDKALEVADSPEELARELEMHSELLEMSSRYE